MKALMRELFIAAGSNLFPETHLPRGLELLLEQMELSRVSTHYRSPPLGDRRQADYVNGIWHGRSGVDPREIKSLLRDIEKQCGRVRGPDPYASRTLDLDLIIVEDTVLSEPGLMLPDSEIRERDFVYIPLLELEPDIRLPGERVRLADQVGRGHELYYSPVTELLRNLL